MNYHIIIAVILFTAFSLFLTSCNPPDYDYCVDSDIYVNGRFSHVETICYY